jgi:precorrin-4 methylase
MHQISEENVHLTFKHALLSKKHGDFVVAIGKRLQKHENLMVQEHGYAIEQYGKLIQYYATQSLMYSKLLMKGHHVVEFYTKAVESRMMAAKLHSMAVSIYSRAIEETIDRVSDRMCLY